MIKKRIIITLTFVDGILFRTKNFKSDYRYTKNFIDLWTVDEIILIDVSKQKLKKNFLETIRYFVENCHVPISVGGGIKNLKQVDEIMSIGVEKIILNSSSYNNFELIKQISEKYGTQSIVHSIDCKKVNSNYHVCFENNTINTNIDVRDWAKKLMKQNIGEILINNVDSDGSLLGYDIDLIRMLEKNISVPILVLGGCGNWNHVLELFNKTDVSGACTQNIYHFSNESLISLKSFLKENNIPIRN